MQWFNTFLAIMFAIHGFVFSRLYFKRKQIRYIYLVGTFTLLTIAFAMLAVDFRPVVDLFLIKFQLPTVLRICAVVTTLIAIYLFIEQRKSKDR